jgi:hypothetical protein
VERGTDIKIPNFSGKYTEYKPFFEIFNALVHDDISLQNVQKLFYLRHFLKEEAYDLIKNLPVEGDSYQEALDILENRFNNGNKIVSEHVFSLLDVASVGKPSAANLRNFVGIIKQHIAALRNLQQPVDQWDTILVCILSRKTDMSTNRAFYYEIKSNTPTVSGFIEFLEAKAFALENSDVLPHPPATTPRTERMERSNMPGTRQPVFHSNQKFDRVCIFCKKEGHKVYNCPNFILATTSERIKFIKKANACMICLNKHAGRCKFHFKCFTCKKQHHSLLHLSNDETEMVSLASSQRNNSLLHPSSDEPERVSLTSSQINKSQKVLLPTCKVKILTHRGAELTVKALLDTGSQNCFITKKLAKEIGKIPKNKHTSIVGISQKELPVEKAIDLEIYSLVFPFKVKTECLIIDNITSHLPQQEIDISKFVFPKHMKLADDTFHLPSEVNLLLGSDIFFQVLMNQASLEDVAATGMRLLQTRFGVVVAGRASTHRQELHRGAVNLHCHECETGIRDVMCNFWKTESVPEVFVEHSSENQQCEELFQSSVELKDRRFTVSLPLKVPEVDVNEILGDSLNLALNRFLNMEKRFKKDHNLFVGYKKFIQEYLDLNHAEYIDISQYNLKRDAVYFLPHHPIIKQNAITTKLRVVFDGSMKTTKKITLNDLMLKGANVQLELFDILLLFRLHKHIFVCDIQQMYRNILLDKSQRSLQNMLWRNSPEEPIRCIQLKTITYGLKSSPFLATRCLKELADRFGNEYPLASFVLRFCTYMDDILVSEESLDVIHQIKDQLINLLNLGGFSLHKWSTNLPEIVNDIPIERQHIGEVRLQEGLTTFKALGLTLDVKSDVFKFCYKMEELCLVNWTKREILSFIGKLFDPLGLLGPIFVTAKVILQKIWNANVGWDENPPEDILIEWEKFYYELTQMSIEIKRNLSVAENSECELVVKLTN